DPSALENLRDLQAAVRREGGELGIAFDGDGDRIGAVDDRGRPVFGDQLLVLLGRDLARRMGPGHAVIFDVKCSEVLPRELARAGLVPTMWKTGHSLIKHKMKETRAPLAGEMSGHMFFGGAWYGFDDELLAGARLLPDRSRELARRAEPGRVKPVVRRRALLVGVGLLVAVLVGGRWLALETAERAWGASLPGGSAYLTTRDFARLVSGLLLVGAIAWGTANLLFVYRSIGSMQLSRRLGDLEIVEAVPQPLLLAGTIACGLAFGFLLSLGTGDWWMAAALASRPPTFGVTDPVLHQDLGYYLGQLPWTERLRELALVAVGSASVVVALLYVGIGSLRFRRWLPYANAHARAHLGVLLALLALTLTWGALLDPAESVAGLHGTLT